MKLKDLYKQKRKLHGVKFRYYHKITAKLIYKDRRWWVYHIDPYGHQYASRYNSIKDVMYVYGDWDVV